MNKFNITLVSNQGSGRNEIFAVNPGTRASDLFAHKFAGQKYGDMSARVNNEDMPANYILQAGDVVAFTPKKIAGAR